MTVLFLVLGYLGVPVAFALIAGVLVGTLFTPITLQSIDRRNCSTASTRKR